MNNFSWFLTLLAGSFVGIYVKSVFPLALQVQSPVAVVVIGFFVWITWLLR
jgi:hypothetical protein